MFLEVPPLVLLIPSLVFVTVTCQPPCQDTNYKMMASIRDLDFKHICSGSILDHNWILTSVHCGQVPELVVAVGGSSGSNEILKVDKIHLHRGNVAGVGEMGIALLKLKEPIAINGNIEFVKLPTARVQMRLEDYCVPAVIKGWNNNVTNDILMYENQICADLKILSPETCLMRPEYFGGGYADPNTIVCTENRKILGACRVDYGGPIMCKGFQLGVATRSADCRNLSVPGVFTRVDAYLDIIKSALPVRQVARAKDPSAGGPYLHYVDDPTPRSFANGLFVNKVIIVSVTAILCLVNTK